MGMLKKSAPRNIQGDRGRRGRGRSRVSTPPIASNQHKSKTSTSIENLRGNVGHSQPRPVPQHSSGRSLEYCEEVGRGDVPERPFLQPKSSGVRGLDIV